MNKIEEMIANMTVAEQEHAVDMGHKYIFTACAECEINPGVLEVVGPEGWQKTVMLCIHCVNTAAAGKLIWKNRSAIKRGQIDHA